MRSRPKRRVFHEDGQRLTLYDHGTHHELMIGHVPILTSAALQTERDFGAIAATLRDAPSPRVLIGGLGFGATLASVLRSTPPNAEVLVVERLLTVIDLVRGDLAHLNPGILDDPRTSLIHDDVARVIEQERNLDLILLDVDNGPEWASFRTNARLYGVRGLRIARRALRPGGTYAVWSGYPADGFVKRLRAAGFAASVLPFYERRKLQARAYVGRKR